MRNHLAIVASLSWLGGCGNSAGMTNGPGPVGDETCALSAGFTGAATWQATAAPACAIPFGGDTGTLMVFVPIDDMGLIDTIEIDVADIAPGVIGGFPATLAVRLTDLGVFNAPICTVDVDEHRYVKDAELGNQEFRLVGTGTCDGPATQDGGGNLDIAPFEFRFSPYWPKS